MSPTAKIVAVETCGSGAVWLPSPPTARFQTRAVAATELAAFCLRTIGWPASAAIDGPRKLVLAPPTILAD